MGIVWVSVLNCVYFLCYFTVYLLQILQKGFEQIIPLLMCTCRFHFKGIIDYIFYSKQYMTPLGLLGPLNPDWLKDNKVIGCPHPHIPSGKDPIQFFSVIALYLFAIVHRHCWCCEIVDGYLVIKLWCWWISLTQLVMFVTCLTSDVYSVRGCKWVPGCCVLCAAQLIDKVCCRPLPAAGGVGDDAECAESKQRTDPQVAPPSAPLGLTL